MLFNSNSSEILLAKFKGLLVKSAMSQEVLARVGEHKMVHAGSDTAIPCKYFPPVNPDAPHEPNTIRYDKILLELDPFIQHVSYPKNTVLHGDDAHSERMIDALGKEIGQLREMIRWGMLRACASKWYAGACCRELIDKKVTLNLLRNAVAHLKSWYARPNSRILSCKPDFEMEKVPQGCYFAFVHPHQSYDIYQLPGFVQTVDPSPYLPQELGFVDDLLFFQTPVLTPFIGQGWNAASTGLEAANNSRVNVYPLLITGAEAWTAPVLRGMESFLLDGSVINKIDPSALNHYFTVKFWDALFTQHDFHMTIVEAGISENSA